MNWFQERRLDYIDFRMLTVGTIRRSDIMQAFGVSLPQASADIYCFLCLYPKSLVYDKSKKCYVHRKNYKTLRNLTPALRRCWSKLGWI